MAVVAKTNYDILDIMDHETLTEVCSLVDTDQKIDLLILCATKVEFKLMKALLGEHKKQVTILDAMAKNCTTKLRRDYRPDYMLISKTVDSRKMHWVEHYKKNIPKSRTFGRSPYFFPQWIPKRKAEEIKSTPDEVIIKKQFIESPEKHDLPDLIDEYEASTY